MSSGITLLTKVQAIKRTRNTRYHIDVACIPHYFAGIPHDFAVQCVQRMLFLEGPSQKV